MTKDLSLHRSDKLGAARAGAGRCIRRPEAATGAVTVESREFSAVSIADAKTARAAAHRLFRTDLSGTLSPIVHVTPNWPLGSSQSADSRDESATSPRFVSGGNSSLTTSRFDKSRCRAPK